MRGLKELVTASCFIALLGVPVVSSLLVNKQIAMFGTVSYVGTEHFIFRGMKFYGSEAMSNSQEWDSIFDKIKEYNVSVATMGHIDWDGFIGWIHRDKYWAGAKYPPQDLGPRDYVAECIDKLHARGIQYFLKVAVFSNTRISEAFPQISQIRSNGSIAPGGQICPLSDYTEEYTEKALNECLSEYNVDGVVLDHIRFDYMSCFCDKCKAAFQNYIHENLTEWPTTVQDIYSWSLLEKWRDWKVSVIDNGVIELTRLIHSIKPNIPVIVQTLLTKGIIDQNNSWGPDHRIHGQDYFDLASITGFLSPMAYETDPNWIVNALAKIKEDVPAGTTLIPCLGYWGNHLGSQLASLLSNGFDKCNLAFYDDMTTEDWQTVRTYYS
jgi:hypothetical protein